MRSATGLVALLSLFLGFAAGSPTPGGQTPKPVTAITSATTADPLDLNTATLDQLKALPGIGDAYAKRVVDGRPYTAKNQLTQRGILPAAAYTRIKDLIVARRAPK